MLQGVFWPCLFVLKILVTPLVCVCWCVCVCVCVCACVRVYACTYVHMSLIVLHTYVHV